jgi:hypothetical protein
MPRDTLPPRPYFRCSTADIAALLDASPSSSDLRAIAHELGYRQTRGARLLAVEVDRQLAAVAALADHMAKPDPVAPVTAKPAKVARPAKVASVASAKPAHVFKWMKGGNKLQTPVGGFDWAAYDAVQAEHHALIRAKFGSLATQEAAIKRADRADMKVKGQYNTKAADAFRAHMEKARVAPVAPPAPLPSVKEAAAMADAAMIGKGADRRASVPAKRAVAF